MKSTDIHPKVAAGAAGGMPLAVVLVWIAGLLGVDMPAEVAAALAGLLGTVAAYLMPSTKRPAARHAIEEGAADNGVLMAVFLLLGIITMLVWLFR